uniref:Activin types I and II receptor domain-containing protein n=1 Tax=Panagrellus redivivus TaxID=6233 RepID=A0A7E4VR59_PANRE
MSSKFVLLAVFGIVALVSAVQGDLVCAKWSKRGDDATKFEDDQKCTGVCLFGAVVVNGKLNIDGECSHEPAPVECQKYEEDGKPAFACACSSTRCNSLESFLKIAEDKNAANHLGVDLPKYANPNAAVSTSALMAVATTLFGAFLTSLFI